jgi:hypothetical protein
MIRIVEPASRWPTDLRLTLIWEFFRISLGLHNLLLTVTSVPSRTWMGVVTQRDLYGFFSIGIIMRRCFTWKRKMYNKKNKMDYKSKENRIVQRSDNPYWL